MPDKISKLLAQAFNIHLLQAKLMTRLAHHTHIEAGIVSIQGSCFDQLYNRGLNINKGRFTYQLMQVNSVNFKRLWMTRSIGVNEGVDNQISITITKRNFDDLVFPAATAGFGIKEQGFAGIVPLVVLGNLVKDGIDLRLCVCNHF